MKKSKKVRLIEVKLVQNRVRELAEQNGLTLRVGKNHPYHWMIENRHGRRILDYWPTTQKYRNPSTGETGYVDHISLVRVAVAFYRRLFS